MSWVCKECGSLNEDHDQRCWAAPPGQVIKVDHPLTGDPYRSGPIRTDVKDLEEFLVLKYPEEVTAKGGESAVQVAIRLLGEYAEVRRIINSGFFEDSVDVHTGMKTRRIKRNG